MKAETMSTPTKVVLGFTVSAAILLCTLTAILTVAIVGIGLVHILPRAEQSRAPRLFPNLTQTPTAPSTPARPAVNAADIGPLNTVATDELKNCRLLFGSRQATTSQARWTAAKSCSPNYSTWQESPTYQLASPQTFSPSCPSCSQ